MARAEPSFWSCFSDIGHRRRSSILGVFGARLSHALAGEFDAMGVMNEAVEDGVGIGWITDDIVPAVDGKLACDDGGAAAIALGASARASGYHDHPHEAPGIHRSRRPPVTGERPRSVTDGRLESGFHRLGVILPAND